ncbi:MAG: hypothetical protein AB1861_00350 [Cyanobacteriota bacterium]
MGKKVMGKKVMGKKLLPTTYHPSQSSITNYQLDRPSEASVRFDTTGSARGAIAIGCCGDRLLKINDRMPNSA